MTGRIAALSRFISRLTNRCKPFFTALRAKQADFWGLEQTQALANLKKYLSSPNFLVIPHRGEPLYLYLAILTVATRAALFREKNQRQEAKGSCDNISRAMKLRYAQICPSELSLISIPDSSGRMTKWAIELSEFDIKYLPRTARKGQVFADFLVECYFSTPIAEIAWKDPIWEMYVDNASNFSGAGAGIILQSSEDLQIECAIYLDFSASNNVAEYEALVKGIGLAKKLCIPPLQVHSDSQLIVELSNERYAAKDERMSKYRELVREMMREFEQISLVKVPRGENSRANELAKAASGRADVATLAKIEVLEGASIEGSMPHRRIMMVEAIPNDWRGKIVNYLEFAIQPDNPIESRKLRIKAARHRMIEGELFRQSFSGPLLQCFGPAQAILVLTEIHEGSYGAHIGGRNLAHKVMFQGYYWPYLAREAAQYVRKCDKCQKHAPTSNAPAEELNTLGVPWVFARWGMDIVGPLPTAPGGFRYVLLSTNYFTKWVQAESYIAITGNDVIKFTWKNIICRFGTPRYIVCDNEMQFNNAGFQTFCQWYGITLQFSSRSYPQGNGQAEKTNRTIFDGVKWRLERRRGKWHQELQYVLWAYRTTRRKPTNESSYALTYGMEAIIPTKNILPKLRTWTIERGDNDGRIEEELDLLEEK